jgi:hypothetical protein
MKLDKKNILIGAGIFAVVYFLGEQKQKKATKECKRLVPTKFAIDIPLGWTSKHLDLTPKLFRKVVTMKEWRSSYELNPIFTLATINEPYLWTDNGAFMIENGKYFRKPTGNIGNVNDKVEITKADFQKEIDSYNAKRLKREDELNTCKGSNLPMKVSMQFN